MIFCISFFTHVINYIYCWISDKSFLRLWDSVDFIAHCGVGVGGRWGWWVVVVSPVLSVRADFGRLMYKKLILSHLSGRCWFCIPRSRHQQGWACFPNGCTHNHTHLRTQVYSKHPLTKANAGWGQYFYQHPYKYCQNLFFTLADQDKKPLVEYTHPHTQRWTSMPGVKHTVYPRADPSP